MVIAFVLITTKSGAERDVREQLLKNENIKEAHVLYGEYDLIAKVELDDVTKLNDFILDEARKVSGVERTSTLIIAE